MEITAAQIRAARALLGWSLADLSKASGVSHMSAVRFDNEPGKIGNLVRNAIMAAFQRSGIEFVPGGAKLEQKQ